jgi:hypothetical protein
MDGRGARGSRTGAVGATVLLTGGIAIREVRLASPHATNGIRRSSALSKILHNLALASIGSPQPCRIVIRVFLTHRGNFRDCPDRHAALLSPKMASGYSRELSCRPLCDRRGDTAPADRPHRCGRGAVRETSHVALSVHGYQAIPSMTMPEAEEAAQRSDPGNIDLVITNIDITPALRRKRGCLSTLESPRSRTTVHLHQRNLGRGEVPDIGEVIIKTLRLYIALTLTRQGEDRVPWL